MSARGTLSYHDAASSSHGRMHCPQCNKPITEGQYRVRETRDAYITHHRPCVANDPQWTLLDGQAAARAEDYRQFREAAVAFYRRWDVVNLRDVLEDAGVLS